jgi:hypothetical protein
VILPRNLLLPLAVAQRSPRLILAASVALQTPRNAAANASAQRLRPLSPLDLPRRLRLLLVVVAWPVVFLLVAPAAAVTFSERLLPWWLSLLQLLPFFEPALPSVESSSNNAYPKLVSTPSKIHLFLNCQNFVSKNRSKILRRRALWSLGPRRRPQSPPV